MKVLVRGTASLNAYLGNLGTASWLLASHHPKSLSVLVVLSAIR